MPTTASRPGLHVAALNVGDLGLACHLTLDPDQVHQTTHRLRAGVRPRVSAPPPATYASVPAWLDLAGGTDPRPWLPSAKPAYAPARPPDRTTARLVWLLPRRPDAVVEPASTERAGRPTVEGADRRPQPPFVQTSLSRQHARYRIHYRTRHHQRWPHLSGRRNRRGRP